MNRIPLCDAPNISASFPHSNDISTLTRQPSPTRARPDHGVFVPLHYESNYAYPLIVWLHSPGDNHGQLKRIMPRVSMRNYVAVSPCGDQLVGSSLDANSRSGYNWRQDATSIDVANERVLGCIDVATSRFNVNENRVFLAGCDAGGTTAIRLGLLYPERFAGIVSFGGRFPRGLNPLARLESARQLPIMLGCRIKSVEYPVAQVCADLRLMHSAGIPVFVRQYDCQNKLLDGMLKDMNDWLMHIVTGNRCPCGVSNGQLSCDEYHN